MEKRNCENESEKVDKRRIKIKTKREWSEKSKLELKKRKLNRSKEWVAQREGTCDKAQADLNTNDLISSYRSIIEDLRNRPKIESKKHVFTEEDNKKILEALKRAMKK